jgi:threonine/homoserine/homoserine lactone efflux protein
VSRPCAVAGFLLAILPLIVTPGASLALLVRHVTEGGRRRAVGVILGTATGLYVHAALAAAGLSALVMHSSQAFTAVKVAGAGYLIGLGLWTWRSAAAGTSGPAAGRPHRQPAARPNSPYGQALFANVLNPKAASIYLTLAPQFLTPDEPLGGQILTLATAQALLVTAWLLVWTALVRRAAGALGGTRLKRALFRATSVVLVGLGVRSLAA